MCYILESDILSKWRFDSIDLKKCLKVMAPTNGFQIQALPIFTQSSCKICTSINQTLNKSLTSKHKNEDYTVKNVLSDLTNINEFL